MAQKNVELVRRIWEAAEHREDEALFALYDPDIVWQSHYVGPMETGGLYRGHEGIRRFFRDWLESFDAYEARAETFIEVHRGGRPGRRWVPRDRAREGQRRESRHAPLERIPAQKCARDTCRSL